MDKVDVMLLHYRTCMLCVAVVVVVTRAHNLHDNVYMCCLQPQGEEGHVHGATCGHAHACCGHEAPPEEPSQEEYEGALAEATQLLDK